MLIPTSFSHILLHYSVMFQPKLNYTFSFLRNYSKRPHLQNKGNVTSKEIRSQQIEAKSLMGKGLSSSLLLWLQKSEYILDWINNVWIKLPSKRPLRKWNLYVLQYSSDIFKYNLVKNRSTLKVFIFDTTQLRSKQRSDDQCF